MRHQLLKWALREGRRYDWLVLINCFEESSTRRMFEMHKRIESTSRSSSVQHGVRPCFTTRIVIVV